MTLSRTGANLRRLKSLGTVYLYRYENDQRPYDRQTMGAIKFAVGMIEEVRARLTDDEWQELVAAARDREVKFPPSSELRKENEDGDRTREGEQAADEDAGALW